MATLTPDGSAGQHEERWWMVMVSGTQYLNLSTKKVNDKLGPRKWRLPAIYHRPAQSNNCKTAAVSFGQRADAMQCSLIGYPVFDI